MIKVEFVKVVENLCSEKTPSRPTNEIKDLVTSLSLFFGELWVVCLFETRLVTPRHDPDSGMPCRFAAAIDESGINCYRFGKSKPFF